MYVVHLVPPLNFSACGSSDAFPPINIADEMKSLDHFKFHYKRNKTWTALIASVDFRAMFPDEEDKLASSDVQKSVSRGALSHLNTLLEAVFVRKHSFHVIVLSKVHSW